MLGKCKVLSNHMVFIKLSQVIVFPYILGMFQKKVWFLNSRIAGRGVKISHPASVSDRTCRTGHFFTWGKMTKTHMFSIKLILLCILICTFQAAESSKTLRGSLGHCENNVSLFCADVSASQRLEYGLHNMQTYLITITHIFSQTTARA